MQRDVGFADDAFVEEEGTHGAGKQGMAGGEPAVAGKDGKVGEGGVGDESVLHDDDVVAGTLLRQQFVEPRAVEALEGIVDTVVCRCSEFLFQLVV